MKSNCSKHKKEVAGISDMTELAKQVGDLHYETLTAFFGALAHKISMDGHKDKDGNRPKLADQLYNVAGHLASAQLHAGWAWELSKPFMTDSSHPLTPKSYPMEKLKTQEVYTLTDIEAYVLENDKRLSVPTVSACGTVSQQWTFEAKTLSQSHYKALVHHPNMILISPEDLRKIVGDAWKHGDRHGNAIALGIDDCVNYPTKEQYINSLFK